MPESNHQGLLNVSLLDMSNHNQAILEFFFKGAGKNVFNMVSSHDDADVFISDFDQPQALQNWQSHFAESQKPVIVLAYKQPEAHDKLLWLPKPLSSIALMKAANDVKAILSGAVISSPAKTTSQTAQPPSSVKSAGDTTNTVSSIQKPSMPDNPLKHKFVPPKVAAKQATSHTFRQPGTGSTQLVTETRINPRKKPTDQPKKVEEKPVDIEARKKRWQQLCGDYPDIQNTDNWQQECVNYAPENYFISSLKDALRLAMQSKQMVELKTQDEQMVIMPDVFQIYFTLGLKSDAYIEFCQTPIRKSNVHIHILNTSEAELARHKANQNKDMLNDLEAFVWTSQLLTAQGRLPRGVDINKPELLKYWPNVTRVEEIPHFMSIAALWADEASSMLDLSRKLKIPQRYVFSFYNASTILGLMEQDNSKLKAKTRTEAKPKNRGLFSRLLKRLIGS
jgi:hypothetical protein